MTMAEKKMVTLGLNGKIMYLSRAHLKELREKYPAAKIVRSSVSPSSMPKGWHPYYVENWREVEEQ